MIYVTLNAKKENSVMLKKIILLLLLSFNVSAFTITPSMTGSWFDPNNPGQGFNVEVLDNKKFG